MSCITPTRILYLNKRTYDHNKDANVTFFGKEPSDTTTARRKNKGHFANCPFHTIQSVLHSLQFQSSDLSIWEHKPKHPSSL